LAQALARTCRPLCDDSALIVGKPMARSLFVFVAAWACAAMGDPGLGPAPPAAQGATGRAEARERQPANYVDVRLRVAQAYAEKAHEMGQAVDILQALSKQTAAAVSQIERSCGPA